MGMGSRKVNSLGIMSLPWAMRHLAFPLWLKRGMCAQGSGPGCLIVAALGWDAGVQWEAATEI